MKWRIEECKKQLFWGSLVYDILKEPFAFCTFQEKKQKITTIKYFKKIIPGTIKMCYSDYQDYRDFADTYTHPPGKIDLDGVL